MLVDFEYQVKVTANEITGRLIKPQTREEWPAVSEETVNDAARRLRLDSIDVLRAWLNRWTALTRMSQYEHLTVRNTFMVLGRHMYAAVFPGEVGQRLLDARRTAREAKSTLRLMLSFEEAEDLAHLPWELLHDGEQFLASELRLVLSRSLPLGRRPLLPPEPPLVVQFLNTVPETEEYKEERDQLLASLPREGWLEEYPDYSSRITYRRLDDWTEEEAVRRLATKPLPQIVHIVGVCRRARDRTQEMEIYLDDGAGPDWQSAQILVNLFSGNDFLPDEDQVRLVVLHLCEPSPLDFEVTFERLAPELIRRGVPAVLAMQYPVSGQAAGRFVKRLYESLAGAGSIEEAVQRARTDLFTRFDRDRLFGSPVLYMQTVDSQLLKLPTGSPAGADAGPSSVSATKRPPSSTLDWMLQQLAELDEPATLRQEAEHILRRPADWPERLSEVERRLSRQVRDYAYRPDLARTFSSLVKAVQDLMGEHDD